MDRFVGPFMALLQAKARQRRSRRRQHKAPPSFKEALDGNPSVKTGPADDDKPEMHETGHVTAHAFVFSTMGAVRFTTGNAGIGEGQVFRPTYDWLIQTAPIQRTGGYHRGDDDDLFGTPTQIAIYDPGTFRGHDRTTIVPTTRRICPLSPKKGRSPADTNVNGNSAHTPLPPLGAHTPVAPGQNRPRMGRKPGILSTFPDLGPHQKRDFFLSFYWLIVLYAGAGSSAYYAFFWAPARMGRHPAKCPRPGTPNPATAS